MYPCINEHSWHENGQVKDPSASGSWEGQGLSLVLVGCWPVVGLQLKPEQVKVSASVSSAQVIAAWGCSPTENPLGCAGHNKHTEFLVAGVALSHQVDHMIPALCYLCLSVLVSCRSLSGCLGPSCADDRKTFFFIHFTVLLLNPAPCIH